MRSTFDRDGGLARLWAANITSARHARGWTKADLAELMEVDKSTVGRWENGHTFPTIVHQHLLARMLDVPLADLFPLSDPAAD